MKQDELNEQTVAIHHHYDAQQFHGSLATPLFQTSTYAFETAEQGERRFRGEEDGYIYSRLGNPTVQILQDRIAALEQGEAALAFSSGMAAVSAILTYLTKAGDHIVCSRGIYGCTFGLLQLMEEKYEISHHLIRMTTEQEIEQAIQPNTTCIYVETPINPTMELVNLKAVVAVAKRHNIRVVVDNTFSSPYLQKPLTLGVDYVLHSATKYINGHGDVIAGLLIGRDGEQIEAIHMSVLKDYGGVMAPFDAWLLLRGLKTLPLRMDKHTQNAQQLLTFLKSREEVDEVYYPFDDNNPQYAIAKEQMRAGGGILSFTLKGTKEDAQRFMNRLRLIKIAVSLGDAETLIQHPATMTHAVVPEEERLQMGITDQLLRLSVGLEHIDDLINDLTTAFEA